MPRYVVLYHASPVNFFYGRLRSRACGSLQLADARVYDWPRFGATESPIAVAFRLANAGPPPDGKTSAPAPRLSVGVSSCDVILDVTTAARAAWENVSRLDVMLIEHGTNKIAVIKAVRELTGIGLKEAKDLTESTAGGRPVPVLRRFAPEVAAAALKKLQDAGATGRLDPSE